MKTLKNPSEEYLKKLIEQGEHENQDFKYEISDAKKISKSLSAFSNTTGGKLLIGVKDNGKIAGIRSEEEIYMIEAAAQMYCLPSINFNITQHKVQGKTVLEVDIPESKNKPIISINEEDKKIAYIRIKDENIAASPIHLEMWRQKDKKKGELVEYTEIEKKLIENIEICKSEFSINKFCKTNNIERKEAIKLIANFVRFNVLSLSYEEKKWIIK